MTDYDAHLSMLRFRCETIIPWGQGIFTQQETSYVIGKGRRVYEKIVKDLGIDLAKLVSRRSP